MINLDDEEFEVKPEMVLITLNAKEGYY